MNRHIMHRLSSIVVVTMLAILALSTCAPPFNVYEYHPLELREEDTVLLIGCVILEPEMYQRAPLTLTIAYARESHYGDSLECIIVKTDLSGYFAVPNMPSGRYFIRQIRQDHSYPPTILWREPNPDKPWSIVMSEDQIGRQGWPGCGLSELLEIAIKPSERVVNFNYLIVTRDYNAQRTDRYIIKQYVRSSLVGDEFYSGRKYHRPPVAEHFLELYPNSEWAQNLRLIIKE